MQDKNRAAARAPGSAERSDGGSRKAARRQLAQENIAPAVNAAGPEPVADKAGGPETPSGGKSPLPSAGRPDLPGTGQDTQIRLVAARLERAMAPMEAAFSDCGGDLTEAVGQLAQLTKGFFALKEMLGGAQVTAALAALDGLSQRLASLAEATQGTEERLRGMHRRAVALFLRIGRLEELMCEVKALGDSAKIQAAQVVDGGVDFAAFTQEIGRLAGLAMDGLTRLAATLGDLVAGMAGARDGLGAFNRQHRQSLETVGLRLLEGLAAAAERHNAAGRASGTLAERSRHMAEELATLVEAMQIGDITRQRGEHIRESLKTLLDVLGGLSEGDRMSVVATVCRLQGRRARDTAAEFRHRLSQILENLSGLSEDAGGLPAQCAEAFGGEAGSSFLADLSHEFEAVHRILSRYAVARAGVEHVLADLSAMVDGMVHYLGDLKAIEADMRVTGLNAILDCGKLGDAGSALAAIAEELHAYSGLTAEDSKIAMACLSDLITDSKDVADRERQIDAVVIEADLVAAVKALEAQGCHASATLPQVLGAGARGLDRLDACRRRAVGQPDFAQALADCAAALDALAEGTGDAAADDFDGVRQDVLQLLLSRCTVASEGLVRRMLAGDTAPANDAQGVEDVLF